jgi:hypothetical protein
MTRNILRVEDDEDFRSYLAMTLTDAGHSVLGWPSETAELSANLENGTLRISWPFQAQAFQLESSQDLRTYRFVGNQRTTNFQANRFEQKLPIPSRHQFYRLKKKI